MTDVGVHPTTFASGATSRFRRFAALLERSAHNEAMARSTHHALEQLPDSVLRDMGLARSEIPFVAGALAARHSNPPADALDRSETARGPAARRSSHAVRRLALVAVIAVSTFAIASCTVIARHTQIEGGAPDMTRFLDFGTAARPLLL